jgi:DNA-binding transcriptional LysR family regulator
MLDLRSIETFLWVARLGGFGLAARHLNTTQPGISQRIAAIEEDLGIRLFERKSRRVALTAKGRELLPFAEQMLRLRSEMLKVAGSPEALRGQVRIGVSETIVHTRLVKLVERIHATYPAITLEIEVDTSRNLRDHLLEGGLDMAFLLGHVIEPNVRNIDFVRYPLAWVASPKLSLPRGAIPLREIARFPVITYLKDTRPHLDVRELLLRNGVTDFKIYGAASLSTIVRLCTEGMGISVVPPVVITRELKSKELRLVDVTGGKLPEMNFAISYLSGTGTHLLEAIAELALRP